MHEARHPLSRDECDGIRRTTLDWHEVEPQLGNALDDLVGRTTAPEEQIEDPSLGVAAELARYRRLPEIEINQQHGSSEMCCICGEAHRYRRFSFPGHAGRDQHHCRRAGRPDQLQGGGERSDSLGIRGGWLAQQILMRPSSTGFRQLWNQTDAGDAKRLVNVALTAQRTIEAFEGNGKPTCADRRDNQDRQYIEYWIGRARPIRRPRE